MFLRRHLAAEADDAIGQRGESIFIPGAHGHGEHQLFHTDTRFPFQRTRIGFLRLRDANGVNDHKVILVFCRGRCDFLQIILE